VPIGEVIVSYDYEIASDRTYTCETDGQALQAFLATLPNVQIVSDGCGAYAVPSLDLFMHLYLEYVQVQGEASDLYHVQFTPRVNCLRLCIPYAYMHHDERDQHYVVLGRTIAQHLGWRCYDEQQDRDIAE
jgi:hypothetical protein